jgi:anti-anti-sigma regulatory factor
MAASVQTSPADASPTARRLGETTAIVSAGPWFSAVTSSAYADLAAESYEAGARAMLLDLTAIRAVDDTGTATLAALTEQLDVVGCELAVAATHPGLVGWLTTAPLDVDLPVHATVEAALADLLRRPV